MKKLLSLLGAVTLMTTSTVFAVACGNSDEYKTENGDSILLHANIGGERIEITSSEVLWKLINETGPQNKSKFLQELVQLMNASFLNQAKLANSETKPEKPLELSGNYALDNMIKVLSTKYTDLEVSVDREIKKEKEDADDNWETTLEEKFPNIEGLENLEAKYRVDKLINGTQNVTSVLLDALLNTDQLGVNFLSKADLRTRLTVLKRDSAIEGFKFEDWIQNETNKNELTRLYVGISTDYSSEVLEEAAKADKAAFDKVIEEGSIILQEAPENITEFVATGAEKRIGMISNSQRYFLEQWFNTQAPLAISEVVFAYAGDKKLSTTPLSDSIFTDNENTDIVTDIDEFFTKTLVSSPTQTWDWILNEGSAGKNKKGTVKKYSKLLTLSNSTDFSSQMLRNSVYSFVKGDTGVSASDLKGVLGANRTDASKMFATINKDEGIIAFFEEDGLHFVRIDGYKYLKETATEQKTIEGMSDGKISNATLEQLDAFNKFHSLKDGSEKVSEIQIKDPKTSLYANLNTSISNEYLRYLVNNSMVKGLSGSITDFDVMAEVKEFVKVTSPSTDGLYTWQTAILSYFRDISGSKTKEEATWDEFVTSFMEFGTGSNSEEQGEVISKNMLNWFVSQIKNVESNVINNPFIDFKTKQDTENKAIGNNTEKFPKGTFDNFELDVIATIRESFVPYKETTSTSKYVFESKTILSIIGGLK